MTFLEAQRAARHGGHRLIDAGALLDASAHNNPREPVSGRAPPAELLVGPFGERVGTVWGVEYKLRTD